jgi:hypothetical protein
VMHYVYVYMCTYSHVPTCVHAFSQVHVIQHVFCMVKYFWSHMLVHAANDGDAIARHRTSL